MVVVGLRHIQMEQVELEVVQTVLVRHLLMLERLTQAVAVAVGFLLQVAQAAQAS